MTAAGRPLEAPELEERIHTSGEALARALEELAGRVRLGDPTALALGGLVAGPTPSVLTSRPAGALLEADAAADLLGVPKSWVLAEARADRIPHRRLGKYVRFEADELLEWSAARGRGPRRTSSHPVSGGRASR